MQIFAFDWTSVNKIRKYYFPVSSTLASSANNMENCIQLIESEWSICLMENNISSQSDMKWWMLQIHQMVQFFCSMCVRFASLVHFSTVNFLRTWKTQSSISKTKFEKNNATMEKERGKRMYSHSLCACVFVCVQGIKKGSKITSPSDNNATKIRKLNLFKSIVLSQYYLAVFNASIWCCCMKMCE